MIHTEELTQPSTSKVIHTAIPSSSSLPDPRTLDPDPGTQYCYCKYVRTHAGRLSSYWLTCEHRSDHIDPNKDAGHFHRQSRDLSLSCGYVRT